MVESYLPENQVLINIRKKEISKKEEVIVSKFILYLFTSFFSIIGYLVIFMFLLALFVDEIMGIVVSVVLTFFILTFLLVGIIFDIQSLNPRFKWEVYLVVGHIGLIRIIICPNISRRISICIASCTNVTNEIMS